MPVTIDGNAMPCQFKYIPLIPKKQKSIRNTAGGTVVQSFVNHVIGSGDIPFQLTSAPGHPAQQALNTLYYDTSATITFVGHYGDIYEGYIADLNQPIEGGWVKASGIFKVVCITSSYAPSGNC